jgi:hypothetical protein
MAVNQHDLDQALRICVAIGVSQPERLEPLPGAIAAAESIAEWASSLGYQTALVTDENEPVSCARLKTTIEDLVGKPDEERDRVIISFAGHGVISGTRDLWLLSRWFTDDEIVDVELMRMRLAYYRPRQVTIISDACRTPPPEDDPTIQGRRILSRSPWEPTEPDCDVLLATGIGKAAFMVRAKETRRAYCLFTHVVTNALWGRYTGAIDPAHFKGPAVTSQTLKAVVRRELPLAANLLNQSQSASIVTNFTPPDDIYTPMGAGGAPPPAVTLEPGTPSISGVRRGPRDFGVGRTTRSPEEIEEAFRRSLSEQAALRPTHFETNTGLAVIGERIAGVASAPGVQSAADSSPKAPPDSRGRWWILDGPPTSLAVQLVRSGRWVCGCLYPRMIGTFTVDRNGAASLVFRPGYYGSDVSAEATEQAIAAMHAGTIMADSALDLAARIREQKHKDPVLGAIAAYLYARAGDFESIRRIAWFYCHHSQPIPIDVALLGGLRLQRNDFVLYAEVPATSERASRVPAEESRRFTTMATPPTLGEVAGGIPWLRQGFSLLEDSREAIFAPLRDFVGGLTPALFTTLEPVAGEGLAELIRKGEI